MRECEAVVTLVPRRGQRKTDEGNISVTAASCTVRMILMILEVRSEILCKQSFKICVLAVDFNTKIFIMENPLI